jgi:hypothetical protein
MSCVISADGFQNHCARGKHMGSSKRGAISDAYFRRSGEANDSGTTELDHENRWRL